MRRNEIVGLSVALGIFIVTIAILILCDIINIAQAIEITILFALVLATFIYAKRTSEIADATKGQSEATRLQAVASMKMAEEMKDARYDAVRPVIDIRRTESNLAEAFAADHGDTSHGLLCILHNIGIGPAIDMRSLVQPPWAPWGQSQRHDFGTLAIGGETTMNLSLEQEGNRTALVANYKDVYGRAFESSREVQAGKKSEGWKVGPLRIRLIEQE